MHNVFWLICVFDNSVAAVNKHKDKAAAILLGMYVEETLLLLSECIIAHTVASVFLSLILTYVMLYGRVDIWKTKAVGSNRGTLWIGDWATKQRFFSIQAFAKSTWVLQRFRFGELLS